MKYVKQFGIILLISFAGEALNYLLPLPVPASIYGLVLMFLCCYALSRRRWCFLIPALPLLLSVGIVLLAPGISGTPRYAYPIVYSLPVVMACYCSLVKKE